MRMPKMAVAAVALAAATSVALPAGAASAHNRGSLEVCNANESDFWLDLWADGPSFRSTSLLDGECDKWSVRPGRYDIGVDVRDLQGNGFMEDILVQIKRNGHVTYRLIHLTDTIGEVETNVRKHRKTKVTFNPCVGQC